MLDLPTKQYWISTALGLVLGNVLGNVVIIYFF